MENSFSVKTVLRTDKPLINGKYPLYYLVIFNSQNLKLSAKFSLPLSEWDKEKNYPKGNGNSILKKKLQQEEGKINDILLSIDLSGKAMTKALIKELYRKGNIKKDFYYYFDEFCKKKFLTIEERTQYQYTLFRKQLKEYKANIEIEEINVKFIEDFLHYLAVEKKVGNSGRATRRKHFSAVLNKFVIDKLITENPCKHIPKPKENVKTTFLTSKEIEKIKKADLNIGRAPVGVELSRKLFLFSCYTGLRYGDVMNLKKENIIGNKKIVIEMKKTKRKVEIPLVSSAFKILVDSKFKDKKPKDRIFNKRLNASINNDLEKIAESLKIEKNITFHVGRHSFGSMLAKNNVQPFYIMKLMGHKDIRMTERYVNSDEQILSDVMKTVKF